MVFFVFLMAYAIVYQRMDKQATMVLHPVTPEIVSALQAGRPHQ